MKRRAVYLLMVLYMIETYSSQQQNTEPSFLKRNIVPICFIGALTIASSIGACCFFNKPRAQQAPVQQPNERTIIESLRQDLAFTEATAKEVADGYEKMLANAREDRELEKKGFEESMQELKKARLKIASIDYVLKAQRIKNAGRALTGLFNQSKGRSNKSAQSLSAILTQVNLLTEEIDSIIKDEELPIMEDTHVQALQSALMIKDAREEVQAAKQSLLQCAQDIQHILPNIPAATVQPRLKSGVTSQSHAKSSNENANGNSAHAFVSKFKNSAPHVVLGIAPDALMPDIQKAFKQLSLQFHPDKDKQHFEAHTEAIKIINNARTAMIQSFNK